MKIKVEATTRLKASVSDKEWENKLARLKARRTGKPEPELLKSKEIKK